MIFWNITRLILGNFMIHWVITILLMKTVYCGVKVQIQYHVWTFGEHEYMQGGFLVYVKSRLGRMAGENSYGLFLRDCVVTCDICLAEVKYQCQDLNKVPQKWKPGMLIPCIIFKGCDSMNMTLICWTGAPHVVTIPIQSANPMKVSTLKGSEPTLLPKTIHLASNPMVSVTWLVLISLPFGVGIF
jgi:hypothetical protein